MELVEVFVCQLPVKRGQGELKALMPNVHVEKQKRMLQFYHLDDAYRTLIGDFLIGYLLYKRTGSRMKEVTIEKKSYGKPFFPEYPSIQYNVSHSGDFVVCAVHDQQVGIDIEKVQSFELQTAKQLFTAAEFRYIFHAENRDLACYDLWTIKEGYVKALGKGLSLPLHSFQVKKINMDQIELTDMHRHEAIKDFTCKQYKIDDGYILSVCAHHAGMNDFIKRPHRVSFESLCDSLCKAESPHL